MLSYSSPHRRRKPPPAPRISSSLSARSGDGSGSCLGTNGMRSTREDVTVLTSGANTIGPKVDRVCFVTSKTLFGEDVTGCFRGSPPYRASWHLHGATVPQIHRPSCPTPSAYRGVAPRLNPTTWDVRGTGESRAQLPGFSSEGRP